MFKGGQGDEIRDLLDEVRQLEEDIGI